MELCKYNGASLAPYPAIILHLPPALAGPEQRANVGQSTDCGGEPIPITVDTAGTTKAFHVRL